MGTSPLFLRNVRDPTAGTWLARYFEHGNFFWIEVLPVGRDGLFKTPVEDIMVEVLGFEKSALRQIRFQVSS